MRKINWLVVAVAGLFLVQNACAQRVSFDRDEHVVVVAAPGESR